MTGTKIRVLIQRYSDGSSQLGVSTSLSSLTQEIKEQETGLYVMDHSLITGAVHSSLQRREQITRSSLKISC